MILFKSNVFSYHSTQTKCLLLSEWDHLESEYFASKHHYEEQR